LKKGAFHSGVKWGQLQFYVIIIYYYDNESYDVVIAGDVVDINAMELCVSEEINLNGILL
jgi:hypothetical protein